MPCILFTIKIDLLTVPQAALLISGYSTPLGTVCEPYRRFGGHQGAVGVTVETVTHLESVYQGWQSFQKEEFEASGEVTALVLPVKLPSTHCCP